MKSAMTALTAHPEHSEELILQVHDPMNPSAPVHAWVKVRIEANEDEIDIHCTFQHCLVSGENGKADVTYGADRKAHGLRLAGKCETGFFEIPDEFQSLRIGSWIMSRIIDWAFQWPDMDVMPIWLGPADAKGDNRERRYRFWTACGYRFEAKNIVSGYSLPCRVRDMTAPMKWQENITVMTPEDFLTHLDLRSRELSVLSRQHDWLKRHPILYGLGRSQFAFCRPPDEAEISPVTTADDNADQDGFTSILEVENDIHWEQRSLDRIKDAPFAYFLEINKDFIDTTKMMALFGLMASLMLAVLLLLDT